MQRPNIYDFGNYRSFLSSMIDFLRAKGEYSHRSFAKKAGFNSHSYVSFLIQGKRNLSVEASRQLATALGLESEEADFFVSMVRLNETKDNDEKNFLFSKMQKSLKSQLIRKEVFDQFEFYESWANVAIYEALKTEWSKINLAGLCEALDLEEVEVEQSLSLLKRLDLIEENSGRYRRKDWAIETPNSTQSALVRRFHHSMGEKALAALDDVPTEEREFGALTLSLSKQNFESLREKIRGFRSEINRLYSEEKGPDALYQINIQFFPLLKTKEVLSLDEG